MLIGSSKVLMKHFISFLLASFGTGSPVYEATNITFEILVNISSRIDLNGSKKMSQSLWLEDCLGDMKSFPQLRPRSSSTVSSKNEYLPITRTLLSYIFASLRQSVDREQIKRGLEFLTKLAIAENVDLFATAPDSFLCLLVEHLCVNVSSSEPLGLSDAKHSTTGSNSFFKSNTKIPACVSAFFMEVCDTEIRDLSLEAIWTLCTFSQVTRLRHNYRAKNPYFFSFLLSFYLSSISLFSTCLRTCFP